MSARPGTLESIKAALGNWRIGSVVLQSFSSGLPLGLVWTAIPAWLAYRGVDIKTIGLFSLAQVPWNFKFLWAPLMDRWAPPFLGRKRSWMLLAQIALVGSVALLASVSADPTVWLVGILSVAIAFASATQDIAIDAYAVEVLERDEQALATGARIALYLIAMTLSSKVGISIAARTGWPAFYGLLAGLFLPMMVVVVLSPEPAVTESPPARLREAVFEPFVDLFRKSRAIEIIAFILLYKLGENLATALITPFLIGKHFTPDDVGFWPALLGIFARILGTFVGGVLAYRFGLGKALWIAGALQALGCLGYIVVDQYGAPPPAPPGSHLTFHSFLSAATEPHRLVMYGATNLEACFWSMGASVQSVLFLRITQKKFSATQFALLSSIQAVPRSITGPIAGVMVDAMGWTPFFAFTVFAAIPGLLMLHRFVPFGGWEPQLGMEDGKVRTPVTRRQLAAVALGGLVAGAILGFGGSALLDALATWRAVPSAGFDFWPALCNILLPWTTREWLGLLGPVSITLILGAAAPALVAARRGIARSG